MGWGFTVCGVRQATSTDNLVVAELSTLLNVSPRVLREQRPWLPFWHWVPPIYWRLVIAIEYRACLNVNLELIAYAPWNGSFLRSNRISFNTLPVTCLGIDQKGSLIALIPVPSFHTNNLNYMKDRKLVGNCLYPRHPGTYWIKLIGLGRLKYVLSSTPLEHWKSWMGYIEMRMAVIIWISASRQVHH